MPTRTARNITLVPFLHAGPWLAHKAGPSLARGARLLRMTSTLRFFRKEKQTTALGGACRHVWRSSDGRSRCICLSPLLFLRKRSALVIPSERTQCASDRPAFCASDRPALGASDRPAPRAKDLQKRSDEGRRGPGGRRIRAA